MENYQAYTTEMVISVFEDTTNPNFSGLWDYFITRRDWWPHLNFLEPGRKTGILTNALNTWTSTLRTNKLAQLVYSHTRVAMVHATTAPYKEAFLYALATVWDVDSVFTLQDNIAQAAFGLAGSPMAGTTEPMAGNISPMAGNSTDNDDDTFIDLPYDEEELELGPLFSEAWNRSRDPECARLDLKKVLDSLPIIGSIPTRAQDNNHNQDGKGIVDRAHKAWQQKLLHALRLLGVISLSDDGEDTYTKLLQLFHLLADLEQSVCDFRKTSSVRHSVTQPNQLFNKEELAAASLAQRINQLSRNGKGRGKGKGKGKGKGSWGANFRQYGKGSYSQSSNWYGKGGRGGGTSPATNITSQ